MRNYWAIYNRNLLYVLKYRLEGQYCSVVKPLGYPSEGQGVKPQHCQVSAVGPLSIAFNLLCSRGALSWLTSTSYQDKQKKNFTVLLLEYNPYELES